MKGGIDVLNHVADIGFVLCYELEDLFILLFKGPIPQFLYLSIFNLIHCQKLLVVLLVRFKEAGFAGKTSGLSAGWIDTDVQNIVSFVTLQEALRRHRPLGLVDVLVDFLARRDRLLLVSRIFAYLWQRSASLTHLLLSNIRSIKFIVGSVTYISDGII